MSDLISEQFQRLLTDLSPSDPWPTLAESGFLDLLLTEDSGGAGLDLQGLFPLALQTGAHIDAPTIIETMAARLVDPVAMECADLEAVLLAGGREEAARPLAAALVAGQMVGALERLQQMTVDYALTRRQFGREIGKFQAIQHQIAVMAQEVMAARIAAEAAFQGPPLEVSPQRAAVAKQRAGQAAQAVCAIAHAVHGAIGVSREHDLHRLTGKLHRWRMAHGGEAYWARALGAWALSDRRDFAGLVQTL
jgi:alkylation response protein AidB-like acyl-CoA dehydrogenase